MKIDFSQKLQSFDGRDIALSEDGSSIATLRWVVTEALMAPAKQGDHIPGGSMVERYDLAAKIHNADRPLDVTVEQAAMIKKLIPLRFSMPVVAAPALKLMEGE